MRIGLFGGSFNPPHVCHQLATLVALECGPVDAVWWVPVAHHAFGKDLVAFDHRVAMARLAASPLGPRVVVRDDEAALFAGGTPSRTLPLLQHLAAAAQQAGLAASFRLIIGSDILAETNAWHRWDDVAALAPPWVLPRQGFEVPASAASYEVAPLALPDVASRDVRAQLRAGGRADGLPHDVAAYIVSHELYR